MDLAPVSITNLKKSESVSL